MDKLRLVYEQTRRAIWMSHLDTMRTLQRAIKRAGIPIRYSEGFNPHELISILLPLSVGTWEYDTADTETVAAKCRELFAAPVEVMRKTKRGEGLFTVTEHVRDLTFTAGDGIVTVEGIVSCAEPVVNPELLTAAVRTHLPDCAPDGGRFCRMALYRADGTPYR